MSFSTQNIKYGWLALASLGVITGTTIYVLNNQRKQVKPEDVIPIALGADERVMALQTGTNASGEPVYPIARPSFVRTWIDTNGASVVVTNTIGWHTDRAMMVSLDTTIKALVPYYVDPASVYDGTTNIVMLTVTGLWASLGIGDGTNKFTRTPAISTNAATYGDYPWQIYVEDLEERYKVLNALKIPKANLSADTVWTNIQKSGDGSGFVNDPGGSTYDAEKMEQAMAEAKGNAETNYAAAGITTNPAGFAVHAYSGWSGVWVTDPGVTNYYYSEAWLNRGAQRITSTVVLQNQAALCMLDSFVLEVTTVQAGGYGMEMYRHYYDNGDFPIKGTNTIDVSVWTGTTNSISADIGNYALPQPQWGENYGGGYSVSDTRWIVTYTNLFINTNFYYCTNKYW